MNEVRRYILEYKGGRIPLTLKQQKVCRIRLYRGFFV